MKSGVKQGYKMSGFLFLLVIDWVMRQTVNHARTGIRFKMTPTPEELDFADDLSYSSTFTQIQKKIDHLNRNRLENQHQENQTHEDKCKHCNNVVVCYRQKD